MRLFERISVRLLTWRVASVHEFLQVPVELKHFSVGFEAFFKLIWCLFFHFLHLIISCALVVNAHHVTVSFVAVKGSLRHQSPTTRIKLATKGVSY